jgi:plastocyanin
VAPTGCTWTSVSQASWITITAGNSGSGNGGVSYIISANADANSRTGTVAIAGQIFTVTQAGSSCTPAISPTTRNHGSGSETGTVTVTAGSGCSWTAVSNVTWITITAGSGGTANGSVSYSVAANADATARTGTATIAGQVFTVTQAGAPCTPSISPTSRSHGAAASTGNTVAVTAGSGCAWTAASNASWLTITAGSSGTGDGTVTYSVAANTGGARTGTMTIAGQTFTVTQSAGTSGVTITITRAGVSPKSLTVPLGTQVTFVNNDVIAHDMTSDPHPEHTDCPELNQVGFLQPGQSRQTGNLVTPRTCGFHDHDLPFNTSLQGSIVIQATRAPAASSK